MKINDINIAIIDDGVNEKFYDIGNLEYNIEITPELKIIERCKYDRRLPSHATTCAAIIRKYSPQACLSSVKILNDERRGVRQQLIKALEWCVEMRIKIVNLSLGTTHYKDSGEIRESVNWAVARGIVIVAACSNRRVITYPAYFSNVIGVKCDLENELKEGQYKFNYYPNDGIDITASGKTLLCRYTGEEVFTEECNSYATPVITSKVYEIIGDNPDITIEEIKSELIKGATNRKEKNYKTYLYKEADWIENAVVFRFNNKKNNKFKLSRMFGTICTFDLNCNCLSSGAEQIKDYLKRLNEDGGKVDTVIIDAENAQAGDSKYSSDKLIQEVLNYIKKIVYLDDREIGNEIKLHSLQPDIKIWHPSIFNYLNTPILKEVDIPLISINDFTGTNLIELIEDLQERFRKDDYNAVSAVDTCNGILYGMSHAPLYNKSIPNDPGRLKTLCGLYNPDVLIYGLNALNKGIDYLDQKNKFYEVDIDIIISVDYNNNVEDYINLRKKSGSQLILIMPEKESKRGFLIDRKVKCFDLFSHSYKSELFTYIIDLYILQQPL